MDKELLSALSTYRKFGYILNLLVIIFGIAGWIMWRWYALPLAVVCGIVIGQVYAHLFYSNLAKKTGLKKSSLRLKLMEIDDKIKGLK